jgi:hypothetical protein
MIRSLAEAKWTPDKWLCAVFGCLMLAALACALPLPGSRQPTAPAGGAAPPPWLSFGSDCRPVHSTATSGGSPNKLDETGKIVGMLPFVQVAEMHRPFFPRFVFRIVVLTVYAYP